MSYETLLDTVHRNKWEETRSYEKPRSETDCRSQYSREYARLIHSPSFRRLQGKTQVLGLGESDFYRTRLTHSLEVMQIGRGIVDTLRFKLKNGSSHQEALQYLPDDKLIETICLAHDLGHPPFGHGGEIALNYCMLDHGGFEGNGQTLRILSKLEKYRKDGDVHYGINPSRRLLLGILKYPAPYSKARPNDVVQSVVSAVRPFRPDAQLAEGQGDVVDHHQHVLDGYILCLHPVAYRLAAEVHVCLRFHQHEGVPPVANGGRVAVTPRRKNSVGHRRKGVQHFETDIVAGFGVFDTRITQANY